jgi:hypothetical protein
MSGGVRLTPLAANRTPPRADPDDWWATTGSPAPDDGPGDGEGDDRLDAERPKLRGAELVSRLNKRMLLAGAIVAAIVLALIGLWASGAFKGSSSPRPPTTAPTTTAAVTTNTTPPTPRGPTAPSETLKPGTTGLQVKRLQRALAALGFPVGKIDGVYGPKTVQALQGFQRKHGLTADGVLGPQTLAALELALHR